MSYRRGKKDYPKEPNDAYMIEWNGIMVVNPAFQPHMESCCSPEECARRYARKEECDKRAAAWREEFDAKPAEEQAAFYAMIAAKKRKASIGSANEHEIHGPPNDDCVNCRDGCTQSPCCEMSYKAMEWWADKCGQTVREWYHDQEESDFAAECRERKAIRDADVIESWKRSSPEWAASFDPVAVTHHQQPVVDGVDIWRASRTSPATMTATVQVM
jgi:hypothetical protein